MKNKETLTDEEIRIAYIMECWDMSYKEAEKYVRSTTPSFEEARKVLAVRVSELKKAIMVVFNSRSK